MIEKEFGGYLPLEIAKDGNEYYQSNNSFNVISLNSGRSAFYFAAKTTKYRVIFTQNSRSWGYFLALYRFI